VIECSAARSSLIALGLLLFANRGGWAVQLEPQAAQAFDRYIAENERRIAKQQSSAQSFLAVTNLPEPQRTEASSHLRAGDVLIRKQEGTPIKLAGAMIHHWVGAVWLPGATIQSTLALVQNYNNLSRYYSPEVVSSRLLSRQGNDFRITMRLRKHKILTVVLDTTYSVHYGSLDPEHAYSWSRSTRVTEIANPGERNEHALAEGDGHGFLWKLNSYWRFVQLADGVVVECEAISLTRDVPAGLGWLIEPIVEKLPRESLEFTLRATRDALR